MVWIEFILSAAVIVYAGIRLTVEADKLSDALNLGKVWIGIVLLGLVTSLPEAVTSFVSVYSLQAYDLAVGNLLGSNNFNPMLIVVMDIMYRKGAVTEAIHPDTSHKVSASFSLLLSCIIIFDLYLNFSLFRIGSTTLSAGSMMIAVCYFIGMRQLAGLGMGQSVIAGDDQDLPEGRYGMVRIWVQLMFHAALVVAGAIWLAKSADIIAQQSGLGGTFFGSIFLALVTSLPEMVVSISALKLGSLDLAIGNIFGSNMTNMFIVFLCSLLYKDGSLLGTASKAHVVTALLSIVLTYIAIKGIFVKNKRTVGGVGIDSWIMIAVFLAGTAILYKLRLM